MQIQRLPKEVLDFFPIWEYDCPKCGSHLGYEPVEYCVKCGAKFNPEQARVPPRFLKNHKAMSEYAHKVLAPKLNDKQRKMLFKYFTVIFSDDFESGDFSAWTGTQGSTIEVVSTGSPHHGTYHCHVSTLGGNVDAYKTFAEHQSVFVRYYIKFVSLPANGEQIYVLSIYGTGASTTSHATAVIRVWNDSGVLKWQMGYRSGAAWHFKTYTPLSIDTNVWYCLEEKVVVSSNGQSDGEQRLYIDGIERLSITNIDNDDRGNIRGIAIPLIYFPVASELYFDCVVVADAYIGREGQLYEIYVDAVVQASAEKALQTIYNIEKDAIVAGSAAHGEESTFNLSKDALVKALADFSVETIFNVVKDAIVKASASPQVLGIYPINVDTVVKTSATPSLQQTLGISKDAVVKVLAEVIVTKEVVKVVRLLTLNLALSHGSIDLNLETPYIIELEVK